MITFVLYQKSNIMNYEKLMKNKPFVYRSITNGKGQIIVFVEHPFRGDSYPVICVCHELRAAKTSEFMETDDMEADHHEYEPYFDENNNLDYGRDY